VSDGSHTEVKSGFEYLQLGYGSWTAASIEANAGFYLSATSPATEIQEIITSAVFYANGTISGVTNPILFATTQGIGQYVVAHNGTVFGQTNAAFTDGANAYALSLDTSGDGTSNTVTNKSRLGNIATLTTSTSHGFSVGDVVTVASMVDITFNATAVVTAVNVVNKTFSYSNTGTDVTSASVSAGTATLKSSKFSAGYNLLSLSSPKWEAPHAHHMWLEPQRTNFIANPSLERVTSSTIDYWRVGSTITADTVTLTQATRNASDSRPYCGHVSSTGNSGRLVLESNFFPKTSHWASISFDVSGTGSVRYGLVVFPTSYSSPAYIRSDDISLTGGNATSNYRTLTALVQVPDDIVEAVFRIEFTGSDFWVDNVMVDPHESQFTYFDGDSDLSLPDDFRWMGGTDYANRHFSMWYNNFKNTNARLTGAVDSTTNTYVEGLAEQWAPNGAAISAHWNAVTPITPYNWIGDAFYPISNVANTTVSVPTSQLSFTLTSLS
jgi:hypothetical protein